jgi:hypothetical protein
MRSRLSLLAPVAWLALAGFGMFDPIGQAWFMPNIISICSGAGTRLIEIPSPGNNRKREDCAKGCHALCQRKRANQSDSNETGN